MHVQYSGTLEEILLENFAVESIDNDLQPNIQILQQTVTDALSDVKHRNEAMLFQHLPPRILGTLSSALSDIKVGRIRLSLAMRTSNIASSAPELYLRENRSIKRPPIRRQHGGLRRLLLQARFPPHLVRHAPAVRRPPPLCRGRAPSSLAEPC